MWEAAATNHKEFNEGVDTLVDLTTHNIGRVKITMVRIVEMNASSPVAGVHGTHMRWNSEIEAAVI